MNTVQLIGHLTKDVELFYSKSGTPVAKTAVAVNNRRDKSVMFINVIFFDKLGELANQYLQKGSKVGLTGRLDLGEWTSRDGVKHQQHSVIVQDLEMLSKKEPETKSSDDRKADFFPDPVYMNDEEIPF